MGATPIPDLDVIIIGAGIAGFAAANALIGARKSVVVLEARERTGGRVFTNTSIGLPFDEGVPTRPESSSALVLIGGHELSRFGMLLFCLPPRQDPTT